MKKKLPLTEREKLEIIKNILKAVKNQNNSISKKSILRVVKIDKFVFDELFKELFEKGFIRYAGKNISNKFSLTDKGFSYLSNFESIIKFIEDFRL